MQIKLEGRVLNWNDLKFDIRLMAQERILGEFLRRDLFPKLVWFSRYQKVDIERLEEIISQAQKQHPTLPLEEQQWIENLRDFYEDFKSFNWEEYNSIMDDKNKRLEYEMRTAIRWATKIKKLIEGYQSPYSTNPLFKHLDDPLTYLLSVAETEYIQGPLGIWRPKGMVEGDNND